jgi:hypothetical protein
MADRCEDPFSADYVTKERLFCPTQSGTGLAEGETGQVEPDSPAFADWLLDAYNNFFEKLSSRNAPIRDLTLARL